MDWKENLRQVSRAEGLRGRALFQRVLKATAHNSPNLPDQFYDGDDSAPLINRLTDAERKEFGLPPRPLTLPHRAATRAGQQQPVINIPVHVICGANNDGSAQLANPKTVANWMSKSIEAANAIYAASGAGIVFTFDKSDVELLKNTLVNQDFVVPSGTNMKTGADTKPLPDEVINALGLLHETERNKIAEKYEGRCVFLIVAGTELVFDETKKVWTVTPRSSYAYSGENKQFVNFPASWGQLNGPEVAHETGHYLHLWHTHGAQPKTEAEATQAIFRYVIANKADATVGLDAFDGDAGSGVLDTPPDPGIDFYALKAGPSNTSCLPGLAPQIKVDIPPIHRSYHLATDRGNVMSYFKDCSNFEQHFSSHQVFRMRTSLLAGNRRHILTAQFSVV